MFDEQRGGNLGDDVVGGNGAAGPAPRLGAGSAAAHVGRDWRQLDRQLRQLAARRAALDAEEARALIAARDAELHRHLGLGSFGEYVERVLGYAPRTARDRLRVAEALAAVPAIHAALGAGDLSFSAARELTRVATPDTERAWLAAAAGKTVREIEDAVRGRRPGDGPGADPDPAIAPRVVPLELSPEAFALFVDARRHLEAAVGEPMTDSDFMATLCRAALAGTLPEAVGNQPPHQLAYTVCTDCARAWHEVPGRSIEVSPGTIEQAACDCVTLDHVDGGTPPAPTRSIPAHVRRMVLARDRHRCVVPGCRAAWFVDLHHLRWRSRGGDHRPTNIVTLCAGHHRAVHDGRLFLDGTADALLVAHADGWPHGAPPPSTADALRVAHADGRPHAAPPPSMPALGGAPASASPGPLHASTPAPPAVGRARRRRG